MTLKSETGEKSQANEFIKHIWDNPIGKVVVLSAGVLSILAVTGVTMKLASYALNNFKDLKAAYMR